MRAFIKSLILGYVLSVVAACGGGGSDNGDTTNTNNDSQGGAPVIASFSPTAGSPGTQVRIEGLQFGATAADNTVQFNGTQAVVNSADSTSLVVDVPAAASSGPIRVITPGGSTTTSDDFTVLNSTTAGIGWTTRHNGFSSFATLLAHNGTTAVVMGDGIYTSDDSRIWQQQSAWTDANDLIWDGTQFVAVGDNASKLVSADGFNWDSQGGDLSDPDLFAITKAGPIWVAVGEGGLIQTSTDLQDWTNRTSPTNENLREVAWNGSAIVAAGSNGTVLSSPDGVDWTLRDAGTSDNVTALGTDGALFVLSTFPYAGSTSQLLSSPDGVTWTSRASGIGSYNDIIYENGQWLAVGGYAVATSADGMSWTRTAASDTNDIGLLSTVTYSGGEYLAAGDTGGGYGGIYHSTDGTSWQLRSSDQRFQSIARSSLDGRLVTNGVSDHTAVSTDEGLTWEYGELDGRTFLEVAWSDVINAFVSTVRSGANLYIYSSSDGKHWSNLSSGGAGSAIAESSTLIVTVGGGSNGGDIETSPDGVTWTPRDNPATNALNDVIWTGSQFVAVGNSGNIVTSQDGITWTARTSGVTTTLNGVVAGNSLLVAVGRGGTLITSADGGATWIERVSQTSYTLNAVEWTGNEFVAVGTYGRAVRSTDGVNWSDQATPYRSVLFGADEYHLQDLVWTGDRLVVVGERGLIATSP